MAAKVKRTRRYDATRTSGSRATAACRDRRGGEPPVRARGILGDHDREDRGRRRRVGRDGLQGVRQQGRAGACDPGPGSRRRRAGPRRAPVRSDAVERARPTQHHPGMERAGDGGGAEGGAGAVAGTPGGGERSGIGEITGGDGCGEADAHDAQRADAAERRTPAAGHHARCSDGRAVDLQLAGALRTAGPPAGLVSPTVWTRSSPTR